MKRKFEFQGIIFHKVPKSEMIPYQDGTKVDLSYENISSLKKLNQSIYLEKIKGYWIASIWNNKDWSIIKKSRKYSTYEKALENLLRSKKTGRRKTVKRTPIEVPVTPSTTEKTYNFVQLYKIQLIIAAIVLVFFGYQFKKSDTYFNLFGLSHEDTVYDYHKASFQTQLYFDENTCTDGKCLPNWYMHCGWRVRGVHDKVFYDRNTSYMACFSSLINTSPSWTKLGDIVHTCGVAHRYFEGFSARLVYDTEKYKERLEECSERGLY